MQNYILSHNRICLAINIHTSNSMYMNRMFYLLHLILDG